MISTRRFAASTRLRLQVHFARAWEALADTYHLQATEFVRRLRAQLPLDEALDRFFREVGVPSAMSDTVRARALIALAPLVEDEEAPEETPEPTWSPLRPDQLIGALRRRARYVEETNLECRLAASIADEAVAATHVRAALDIAELLADECTPDESIMHYVRDRRADHFPARHGPLGRARPARSRPGGAGDPDGRDLRQRGPARLRRQGPAGAAGRHRLSEKREE
jgi:hypothetical protein